MDGPGSRSHKAPLRPHSSSPHDATFNNNVVYDIYGEGGGGDGARGGANDGVRRGGSSGSSSARLPPAAPRMPQRPSQRPPQRPPQHLIDLSEAPHVRAAVPGADATGEDGEADGHGKEPVVKFKTKVCIFFLQPQGCPYGDKCLYAHGAHEVREDPTGTTPGSSPATNSRYKVRGDFV